MWPFTHLDDYNLKLAPELVRAIEVVEDEYTKNTMGESYSGYGTTERARSRQLARRGKPPFIFRHQCPAYDSSCVQQGHNTHVFRAPQETVGVARIFSKRI